MPHAMKVLWSFTKPFMIYIQCNKIHIHVHVERIVKGKILKKINIGALVPCFAADHLQIHALSFWIRSIHNGIVTSSKAAARYITTSTSSQQHTERTAWQQKNSTQELLITSLKIKQGRLIMISVTSLFGVVFALLLNKPHLCDSMFVCVCVGAVVH